MRARPIPRYGYKALLKIEEAAPTAELRPDSEAGAAQTDEEDMGMSYEELGWFGRLRKVKKRQTPYLSVPRNICEKHPPQQRRAQQSTTAGAAGPGCRCGHNDA